MIAQKKTSLKSIPEILFGYFNNCTSNEACILIGSWERKKLMSILKDCGLKYFYSKEVLQQVVQKLYLEHIN